jgi:RNA polymerase sigma-70 factor (ECF subfamily)
MLAQDRNKPFLGEQRLLQRARAGETEAFDGLYREHKDGVYACLWHLLGGEADLVEDAVGNVFLSAYRGLGSFRGESSFATWLYRIAVNEAHARIRHKRRLQMVGWLSLSDPKLLEEIPSSATDPAEHLLRSEGNQSLRRAVWALPEPYRTPVILRYVGGLGPAEISSVLKRPAGTVRYQLCRAMEILRERLGSEESR